MAKLYQVCCPKCNNKTDFFRYGKDVHGHQKYQCKKCGHQWAPDTPERVYTRTKNYPACPVCGKATFLHHDREHYTHYTCSDKKCRHSVFVPKPTAISAPSMSKLFGKTDFKRMRYPVSYPECHCYLHFPEFTYTLHTYRLYTKKQLLARKIGIIAMKSL